MEDDAASQLAPSRPHDLLEVGQAERDEEQSGLVDVVVVAVDDVDLRLSASKRRRKRLAVIVPPVPPPRSRSASCSRCASCGHGLAPCCAFAPLDALDELDASLDRAAEWARLGDSLQALQLCVAELAGESDRDLESARRRTVVVVDLDATSPSSHPFVRAYITSVVETQAASAAGNNSCGAGPLPPPPTRCGSSVMRRCWPSITTSCRSVPGIERAVAMRPMSLLTASSRRARTQSGRARNTLRTTTRLSS